jgi:hypothetical protein
MFRLVALLAAGLAGCGDAGSSSVLLSCQGTVSLLEEGQQVNPRGEKMSVAVAVDLGDRSLTIDGYRWPINGDITGNTVVSTQYGKGHVILNRVTGDVSILRMPAGRLEIFDGVCKPAQKLF